MEMHAIQSKQASMSSGCIVGRSSIVRLGKGTLESTDYSELYAWVRCLLVSKGVGLFIVLAAIRPWRETRSRTPNSQSVR